MNCENILMMISLYLDNELPKEQEAFLFTHLSSCPKCREEFKQQNLIQHEIKINKKKVPEKLEERIFNSVKKKQTPSFQNLLTRPIPVYFSYLLGVVLIVIVLFSYLQISALRHDLNNFQDRYDSALQRIQLQTQQMNLMMSNMPAAVQINGNPSKL